MLTRIFGSRPNEIIFPGLQVLYRTNPIVWLVRNENKSITSKKKKKNQSQFLKSKLSIAIQMSDQIEK